MSKQFLLIVGIICAVQAVFSFLGETNTNIFGMEMNIWIYRLIWSLCAIGIFYDYFKKKKSN